jgi:hypothetical protein
MQDPASELRRILLPRTSVNSPQPTPRSGRYSQRPEVFSEVQVPLKPMLWAGSYTPDFTRVTAGDAHFSPKTCVATRFNSKRILDTGLSAGAEVRHTDTWLRAGPTCGGGAHTIHALPARALFVAFAPSATGLKLGPSGARDGGQRATYEGCSHQLERLTSRDAAASQPASQLVEVAVGGLFAHLGPLSPKGGTRGLGPPSCTTKLSMSGYKPWRNFREFFNHAVR